MSTEIEECSICMCSVNIKSGYEKSIDGILYEDIYLSPCNHIYHKCCISEWLNKEDTCPVCRDKIPINKSIFPSYMGNKNGGYDGIFSTHQSEAQILFRYFGSRRTHRQIMSTMDRTQIISVVSRNIENSWQETYNRIFNGQESTIGLRGTGLIENSTTRENNKEYVDRPLDSKFFLKQMSKMIKNELYRRFLFPPTNSTHLIIQDESSQQVAKYSYQNDSSIIKNLIDFFNENNIRVIFKKFT